MSKISVTYGGGRAKQFVGNFHIMERNTTLSLRQSETIKYLSNVQNITCINSKL